MSFVKLKFTSQPPIILVRLLQYGQAIAVRSGHCCVVRLLQYGPATRSTGRLLQYGQATAVTVRLLQYGQATAVWLDYCSTVSLLQYGQATAVRSGYCSTVATAVRSGYCSTVRLLPYAPNVQFFYSKYLCLQDCESLGRLEIPIPAPSTEVIKHTVYRYIQIANQL